MKRKNHIQKKKKTPKSLQLVLRLQCMHQRWNRSGFSRPEPTGKIQNLRRLTGHLQARLTVFFTDSLRSKFNKHNNKL